MKLGMRLDVYRTPTVDVPVDLVRRAEALGYHSVWSAEAYGADALSPLAYLAAHTSRIRLATAVVQLAARPPATLGMHALTIDALAGGGRMIIGIGVSGPQIVEGWYGQPWGRPNARLRDYVSILRAVLDRREPVRYEGKEISLPYRGPGALGQGKALRTILHPLARIPIWLASGGPRNTELCAELCDGWLPMGLGPDGVDSYRDVLERGFARRQAQPPGPASAPIDGVAVASTNGTAPAPGADFEIFGGASVTITKDVRATLDGMRPLTAMYVGGMGSESHNYHKEAMARRGFPEAAERIGELWRAGRKQEAAGAVPVEYLEQTALVGSPARIRDRWRSSFVPAGVTGVIIDTRQVEALELMADLAGTRETVAT